MNTLFAIDWEIDRLEHVGIFHIDELVDFVNRLSYEPNDPDTFDFLDDQLKSDGLAFVRQGIALGRMCRFRLFQHRKFRSFKEYCQKSLNKSISYCNRLMEAAALVLRLINLGFSRLPQNESQCRPLTKIADDFELREKWQLILDISDTPSHKGIVTASLVADIMEVGTGKQSIRVRPEVYKKLQRMSAGSGKTIDELIDAALDAYSPDEEEEPAAGEEDVTVADVENVTVAPVPAAQKFANWLADLEDLISDHCDPIRAGSRHQLSRISAFANFQSLGGDMKKAAKYRQSLNRKWGKPQADVTLKLCLTVINSEPEMARYVSSLLNAGASDEEMAKLLSDAVEVQKQSLDFIVLLFKDGVYAQTVPKQLERPILCWQDLRQTNLTYAQVSGKKLELGNNPVIVSN